MNTKKRILIVDDYVDFSRSVAMILTRAGYEVVTAASGEQAIEEVKKGPFDLIFIDLVMPDMNGVETLRQLKEIAPETRMVIMTGFAVAGLVTKAMKMGVDGVVYKPFDVATVADALLSQDVLRLYESYLKTVWNRTLSIAGLPITSYLFEQALERAMKEGSLLDPTMLTEDGISLEKLRPYVGTERMAEMRRQLQTFLAAIFDILALLAGNVLTGPLAEHLSDQLKRGLSDTTEDHERSEEDAV